MTDTHTSPVTVTKLVRESVADSANDIANELHSFCASAPHNYPGHLIELFKRAERMLQYFSVEALRRPTQQQRAVSVSEYLSDYEFRGEGGDYTPKDNEKELIEDAIEGYLATLASSIQLPASPVAEPWTLASSGFELDTGAIRLAVTDQCDRNCGWCWHAIVDGQYGNETIGQGGYMPTSDAAKEAATDWTRAYCERTLAFIGTPAQLPASPGTADSWPTEEQVWDSIRLTFDEKTAAKLSFKRWKDGIDIDYPTPESMLFAKQMFAMAFAAASGVAQCVLPAGYVAAPAEPTFQMKQAGYTAFIQANKTQVFGEAIADRMYRAMLAALPSTPSAPAPQTTCCKGLAPVWECRCEIERKAQGHPPYQRSTPSAPGGQGGPNPLADLLREVREKGLIYWEPQTTRGAMAKMDMIARIDTALSSTEYRPGPMEGTGLNPVSDREDQSLAKEGSSTLPLAAVTSPKGGDPDA